MNIILVPNPHLDTPHYKIQRLRHDELNAMEHVPASYEMVEQPEEPKLEDATGEAKKERPEAAVKGIVPDQPAPVVPEHQPQVPAAARAELPRAAAPAPQSVQQSGFMSKILGWFKTDGTKQEAPAANDAVRTAREPRRDHQQQQQRERRPDPRHGGGGGGGGGEQRRDRGGRDRGGRDRPRDEHRSDQPRQQQPGGGQRPDQRPPRDQRPGGERRPDQQQRPPREPRPPRPDQPQQPHQQQAPRSHEPAMAGEGEEQRRGRRNRRDRHRGERRPDQGGDQRLPQGLPAVEHDATGAVPAFVAKTPDANELRAREREMHLAQMREEAARQREEAAAREPVREEPVQVEQTVAPEPQPAPAPARVDPKVILENAGLQMVETNAAKARQPVVEAEPLQLGRPRREKPAAQPAAAEDLVQIETRNK